MSEIRWEDPPPSEIQRPGAGKWVKHLAPLMDHPKRWAVIDVRPTPKQARTRLSNLRHRAVKIPPGRWEFTYRTVDGEHRVYGRYLGSPEDGVS